MSAQENQQRAMRYIAEQSSRVIDYEWEIQHHRQMHEAYESRLQDLTVNHKSIINGHLYIHHGNQTFNAHGARVE